MDSVKSVDRLTRRAPSSRNLYVVDQPCPHHGERSWTDDPHRTAFQSDEQRASHEAQKVPCQGPANDDDNIARQPVNVSQGFETSSGGTAHTGIESSVPQEIAAVMNM